MGEKAQEAICISLTDDQADELWPNHEVALYIRQIETVIAALLVLAHNEVRLIESGRALTHDRTIRHSHSRSQVVNWDSFTYSRISPGWYRAGRLAERILDQSGPDPSHMSLASGFRNRAGIQLGNLFSLFTVTEGEFPGVMLSMGCEGGNALRTGTFKPEVFRRAR